MKRLRRSPLHVSARNLGSAKPSDVSRSDRNRILHSAFIDESGWRGSRAFALKSKDSSRVRRAESFSKEVKTMADMAVFLNRAYLQLIRRYPNEGARSSGNGG
jgi:hypothetical protein